eukprot:COSAG06_NODE_2088_length_7616_cov_2.737395_9_plen_209_part_00
MKGVIDTFDVLSSGTASHHHIAMPVPQCAGMHHGITPSIELSGSIWGGVLANHLLICGVVYSLRKRREYGRSFVPVKGLSIVHVFSLPCGVGPGAGAVWPAHSQEPDDWFVSCSRSLSGACLDKSERHSTQYSAITSLRSYRIRDTALPPPPPGQGAPLPGAAGTDLLWYSSTRRRQRTERSCPCLPVQESDYRFHTAVQWPERILAN